MSLIDYINGKRKGKDAHRLEKEAMRDTFLQDALDGFHLVDDDHSARLATIGQAIGGRDAAKRRRTIHILWRVTIAASIVAVALIGKELLAPSLDAGLQAQNMQRPMDIYVPQTFYDENIAVIASLNTELTRDLSVTTYKRRTNDGTDALAVEEVVTDKTVEPLNVYMPAH